MHDGCDADFDGTAFRYSAELSKEESLYFGFVVHFSGPAVVSLICIDTNVLHVLLLFIDWLTEVGVWSGQI